MAKTKQMNKNRARLRKELLRERKLVPSETTRGHFTPLPDPNLAKTKLMLVLEASGWELEKLLFTNSGAKLARQMGVSRSCICRWRKRLRTGKDR